MIYGIGTDICDVRRIRASLEKHGERFPGHLFFCRNRFYNISRIP